MVESLSNFGVLVIAWGAVLLHVGAGVPVLRRQSALPLVLLAAAIFFTFFRLTRLIGSGTGSDAGVRPAIWTGHCLRGSFSWQKPSRVLQCPQS